MVGPPVSVCVTGKYVKHLVGARQRKTLGSQEMAPLLTAYPSPSSRFPHSLSRNFPEVLVRNPRRPVAELGPGFLSCSCLCLLQVTGGVKDPEGTPWEGQLFAPRTHNSPLQAI